MTKNSGDILYSKGNNDECMTPPEAVYPILEFAEGFRGKTIWCPFDKENSEFVKILQDKDFNVVYSHIENGQDFYSYEPEQWDLIISNPPFTNKRKIFERCIALGKPFALIMTNVWLNDKAPFQVFGEDLQLLVLKDRVSFLREDGTSMGRPSFASSYYCKDFLPKQIIIRDLTNAIGENK